MTFFICQNLFMILKRSEEHTSELQSHSDLVCRLLLEKKKKNSKLTPLPLDAHNDAASYQYQGKGSEISQCFRCQLTQYVDDRQVDLRHHYLNDKLQDS